MDLARTADPAELRDIVKGLLGGEPASLPAAEKTAAEVAIKEALKSDKLDDKEKKLLEDLLKTLGGELVDLDLGDRATVYNDSAYLVTASGDQSDEDRKNSAILVAMVNA